MFTNRDFIERVLDCCNNPYVMAECREMLEKEDEYNRKRQEERERTRRAIKDEILAYTREINDPYASALTIANALDRSESQVNYYIRQLIKDKELPERPTAKKKSTARTLAIANLLEYGKMYTTIDISKTLGGIYHHTGISNSLYDIRNNWFDDWGSIKPIKVDYIEREERKDGKKISVKYWYKV